MLEEELSKMSKKAADAFVRGNFNEAISLLEAILKQQPGNIEALTNLGTIYYESGQASRAVNCYQQAIKQSPQNGLLWFYLSIALYENHELAKALSASEKALTFGPQNQKFWLNHGFLLKQSGVEITPEIFSMLKKKINEKRVALGLPPVELE